MITIAQLKRAARRVRRELRSIGLWSRAMEDVDVVLAPLSFYAHGWYQDGTIFLPAVRIFPVQEMFRRQQLLQDLVRHEYAHAFADQHRSALRQLGFSRTFHAWYDTEQKHEYDPEFFISKYASTSPSEDFAETFAEYVKRRGNRPPWLSSEPIRGKWQFLTKLRFQ